VRGNGQRSRKFNLFRSLISSFALRDDMMEFCAASDAFRGMRVSLEIDFGSERSSALASHGTSLASPVRYLGHWRGEQYASS
jgi:hypothetical protein